MVEAVSEAIENPTVALPETTTNDPTIERLQPQQRRIYDCLASNDWLMRPSDIAKMTGISSASVSGRLTELKKLNLVIWKPGGYYAINPLRNPVGIIDGVVPTVVGWRLQNVNLFALVGVGVSDDVCFDFGGLSISVGFGVSRGKVSVVVGCPCGLTYEGWLLVLDKVDCVCLDRGYVGLEWFVSMCEVLRDYDSMRLDGLSGVTLRDFNTGFVEKIYEKPGGVVRHERRIHGPVDPIPRNTVASFLFGGLAGLDYSGRLSAIEREVEGLKVAQKYGNRELGEIRRGLGEILKVIEPRDGLQGEEG